MKLRHKFWASGSFFLADWNVLRSAHWSVYWVLLVLPQNAAFEYFEYAKQLAVDQPSYTSSSSLLQARIEIPPRHYLNISLWIPGEFRIDSSGKYWNSLRFWRFLLDWSVCISVEPFLHFCIWTVFPQHGSNCQGQTSHRGFGLPLPILHSAPLADNKAKIF